MKIALLGFSALVIAHPAWAEKPPAPQIETTFPPPREARQPDRTMPAGDDGPVTAMAFSADGRMLATAAPPAKANRKQPSAPVLLRLWNARTGSQDVDALVRTLDAPGDATVKLPGPITALRFRKQNESVVAVAGKTVLAWDSRDGKSLATQELTTTVKATAPFGQLTFRPGDEPILAGAAGNRVVTWNFETGVESRAFEPSDARIKCLAFPPDGKTLIAGTEKGALRLWNLETGALIRTIDVGKGVRSCAASASHVVVGGADGRVKSWVIETGQPAPVEAGAPHRGAVDLVTFSSKGGEWASAGRDGIIKVHDVASGQLLCTQQGHKGAVTAVLFNPNGQKMDSSGADRTLRRWTVPLPPLPEAALAKITEALPAKASVVPKRPRKLLVFWRADAILHKGGVPAANKAIELMGKKTGAFTAYFSRDTAVFDAKVLSGFDAIVFNSTAHLLLDSDGKKQALLDYVRAGGGVVGVHAAIDMFKRWPEGAQVIGATFAGHPWNPSGNWSVKLDQPDHVLMRAWGKKAFKMHDEFYELGEPYTRQDRLVLMSLDTADPATLAVTPIHRADKDFAVAWIKRYGAGKVFYSMFGHLADPLQNPAVLQFYLDGIQYALGDLEADATPVKAAAPPLDGAKPTAAGQGPPAK